MKITLNKQELAAIYSAINQAENLIENGAIGEAEKNLNHDIKHLSRITEKARAAKEKKLRALRSR